MRPAVGERAGAILSATQDEVRLLGYGVYEGDFVPDENAGGMAEILREEKITNPRVRLDNGQVVYGCECWWGPEEKIKRTIGDRHVVNVDITEVRAGAANPPDAAQ